MKNINVISNFKNNKKNLEVEYFKACKDKDFKELVDSLDLSNDVLMNYTSRLMQAAKEKKNYNHLEDDTFSYNEIKGFILTPYIVNESLNFKYVACKNKSDELKNIEYLKKGYKFEISKNIRNAKMSEIFTDDKNRVPIIKWMSKFIKEYKKNIAFKGLYLNGNFGSGKTYMISALLNELAKSNYNVAMIYYPEFLRLLKSSFKTDFDEQFDYARKADLLLLDDIGAENITAWSRDEILGPILQYRMDNKLATFFTSNLSIEELEIHLSEGKDEVNKLKAKRIIERIKYLTDDLKLISENKRN